MRELADMVISDAGLTKSEKISILRNYLTQTQEHIEEIRGLRKRKVRGTAALDEYAKFLASEIKKLEK